MSGADDHDDDNASRRAVLARRARFVAAALAGVSVACGKTTSNPQPCLQVVASETAPGPCLNVPMIPPHDGGVTLSEMDASAALDGSASREAGADAGSTTTKKVAPPPSPGTHPKVCLKFAPPPEIPPGPPGPRPQPCLTPKKPNE
jgi:hypothetical protein